MSETEMFRGFPVHVGSELYVDMEGLSAFVTSFTSSGKPRVKILDAQNQVISKGIANQSGYYTPKLGKKFSILMLAPISQEALEELAQNLSAMAQRLEYKSVLGNVNWNYFADVVEYVRKMEFYAERV